MSITIPQDPILDATIRRHRKKCLGTSPQEFMEAIAEEKHLQVTFMSGKELPCEGYLAAPGRMMEHYDVVAKVSNLKKLFASRHLLAIEIV